MRADALPPIAKRFHDTIPRYTFMYTTLDLLPIHCRLPESVSEPHPENNPLIPSLSRSLYGHTRRRSTWHEKFPPDATSAPLPAAGGRNIFRSALDPVLPVSKACISAIPNPRTAWPSTLTWCVCVCVCVCACVCVCVQHTQSRSWPSRVILPTNTTHHDIAFRNKMLRPAPILVHSHYFNDRIRHLCA